MVTPRMSELASLLEVTLSGNAGPFPIPMGAVQQRTPKPRPVLDLPEVEYQIPEEYRELLRR